MEDIFGISYSKIHELNCEFGRPNQEGKVISLCSAFFRRKFLLNLKTEVT